MTLEQQDKIYRLTGFSLQDILSMSTRDFVLKVGRLQAKGLRFDQYAWLENQRKTQGQSQQRKDILEVFGV